MTVSDVASAPPDVKSDLGPGGGGALGRWKEAFLFIICSKRSFPSRGSQRLRIIQKYPSGRQEMNGKSLWGWWRRWWSVSGRYLFSHSVRKRRKKRSSHLRKSLFGISHEGHAIIPTHPSVMEPIDLPFEWASGILMSKVRISVGHKCLVQCTGQELGAITNCADLALP